VIGAPFHLGVTATRRGLTDSQAENLVALFAGSGTHVPIVFHHGDCIGGDAEAHGLALQLDEVSCIEIHPPLDPKHRAFCGPGNPPRKPVSVREPKPYLERNRDIVDASETLVVLPGEAYQVMRSGTWSTWRYAARLGRPFVFVYPSGFVTSERPPPAVR
jgi:hypothetical protein